MRPSQECIDLIKGFEGYRSHAYPDPGTGGAPWTIGYGTTRINGHPVSPAATCTQEEAESWLADEVDQCAAAVEKLVTVPLSQAQFDALISFSYNVGIGALKGSTLLRKINSCEEAADEFLRWNHAGGKVLPGLTRRREQERALFMRSEQPAPIEDRGTDWHPEEKSVAPLIPIIASGLAQFIPALSKAFGGTEVSDRNLAIAETAVRVVKDAVGAVNEQDALSKIQSDPAALQAAKEAVEQNYLAIVGEAGSGGIAGARAADAVMVANGHFWLSPTFWIALSLIPLVYLIAASMLFPSIGGDWTPETRAALMGGIIGTVLGGIVQYYMGSTTTRNRPQGQ